MVEIWVLIIGLAVQAVFFAGVQIMTNKSYGRRIDKLEAHNELQDKQIAETHTGVQVILTKLEYMEIKLDVIAANSHQPGVCQ